jgi:hypothetical protein
LIRIAEYRSNAAFDRADNDGVAAHAAHPTRVPGFMAGIIKELKHESEQ